MSTTDDEKEKAVNDYQATVDRVKAELTNRDFKEGDWVVIHGFDTCMFLGWIEIVTPVSITVRLTHEFRRIHCTDPDVDKIEPRSVEYERGNFHIEPITEFMDDVNLAIVNLCVMADKLRKITEARSA